MGYLYIAFTIAFTVYGQLVLKWQINLAGPGPNTFPEKLWFLLALLLNPWVMSGLIAAFAASVAWMAAMTKFDLSRAYPFMSLNFVLVVLLADPLFGEPLSVLKISGICLIVLGIFVCSHG